MAYFRMDLRESIISEAHNFFIINRQKTYTYQLTLPKKGVYYLMEGTTYIGGTNAHTTTYEDCSVEGTDVLITRVIVDKPLDAPSNLYSYTRLYMLKNYVDNNVVTVTLTGSGSDSSSYKTVVEYSLIGYGANKPISGVPITPDMFTVYDDNGSSHSISVTNEKRYLLLCGANNTSAPLEISGGIIETEVLPLHSYYFRMRLVIIKATSSTLTISSSARTTIAYAEI